MNSRIKEDVTKIFEFWCDVAKSETISSTVLNNGYKQQQQQQQHNNKNKRTGIIIESFPESYHDEQIITKIPDFAYPCEFENDSVQSYSFVLTSDDSKWRFGFCRHDPKTQTAMVLITYLPWHDTFLRLLSILGELRRNKNGEFESFLAEAYNRGVPELGGSLKLFYNSGQNHFIFQRPSQFQLPSIPENHNLNLYYNFIEPKNMISVFAAMLAERRIIFTSRRFDKLSSCIQAANAFLYPMVWQHIFIPVLPMKMKDILSAPMPYLIGVPEAVLQTMTPEELGDVVILNCDNGLFESPFDDVKPMPSEIVSQMKKQLSNSYDHIGDRVSKIFLCVLVQLIGGYRDAVQFTQGQKITWDRDTFIESRPPHLRQFLTKMMELQIFQQFIEERLDMLNTGLGFSDEFELETLRYSEKIGRRGKNYKEFLRNVKEKTNPAVKSAVKSVKEGSRGVKSAYKDLKSKLRDITPPKSQFHSHITSSSQLSSMSTSTSTSKYDSTIDNNKKYNYHQHRSAPSSPIFSKRSINNLNNSNNIKCNNYNDNNSKKYGTSLQTSNSQILNGSKSYTPTQLSNPSIINCSNNNNSQNSCKTNNNQNLNNKSLTTSPTSSLCSSDMNISQELQNHPLFKTPIVDRTVKKIQKQENDNDDTIKDLISLDDSHSNNTSFELEDFDPLNQNAKPFPKLFAFNSNTNTINQSPQQSLETEGAAGVILISGHQQNQNLILTSTSSSLPSSISSSVHNPLYPYYSPQHCVNSTITSSAQLSDLSTLTSTHHTPHSIDNHLISKQFLKAADSSLNNTKNDDDFELLRKYGLDQFTLTNGNTSVLTKTTTKALDKSKWMVFE